MSCCQQQNIQNNILFSIWIIHKCFSKHQAGHVLAYIYVQNEISTRASATRYDSQHFIEDSSFVFTFVAYSWHECSMFLYFEIPTVHQSTKLTLKKKMCTNSKKSICCGCAYIPCIGIHCKEEKNKMALVK